MVRKYIDNNKLTASFLFALALCPIANAAKAESVINNSVADNAVVEIKTAIYTAPNDISLYQLALQSDMTVEELRKLNQGSIDEIDILAAGQTILLPQNTPLLSTNTQNQESVSAISALPQLGGANSEESITDMLLSKTPAQGLVSGTTEENVATLAQNAATQNWEDLSINTLQEETEVWAKNQAKQAVMAPIQKGVNDLLGKFGKGSVNISVDGDGSLKSSTVSLLSPLYDNKESLFFSQVGVNRQNSDRTVGNFGLGYRYEQDSYLVGANTFIDHDFTGSNTRLGLGTELWMDYVKLAANYYTPLSDWKDSSVILDFEERPAEGFDIRAQGYLPSYPQLGASLKYEQYFGEQVGLFGDNKSSLQRDPKAASIGVDYTPVPLLTLKATQRFGDDGQKNTQVDMNLNLQLGTPLEKQLDPDNVAGSRSLKGSRYDLVDRNYDIVFEYRQKAFQVMWNLPIPYKMDIGETLPLQVLTTSKTPVVEVVWQIKTKFGVEVTNGFTLEDLNDNDLNLNFKPTDLGTYILVATVTNQAGISVTTTPFVLNMRNVAENKAEIVFTEEEQGAYSLNRPLEMSDILTDEQKLMLSVKAVQYDENGTNERAINIPDAIWWIQVSQGEKVFINTLDPDLQFGTQDTISLVLSEPMADPINGVEYGLVSAINFGREPVTVKIGYGEVNGESLPIVERQVYFHNFSADDLVLKLVERGVNGDSAPIELNSESYTKTDTYYELIVVDKATNEIVTAEFAEGIRWHYLDGTENIDMEACHGYTMFSTQRTNFDNNEFSWGELVNTGYQTEQGIRLRPSIDPSNWNPNGVLNPTKGLERSLTGTEYTGNVYCPDGGASVEADASFAGFEYVVINGQG